MLTSTTAHPMPLRVLAQRSYHDVTPYGPLLQHANPVHSAFAPTNFCASLN
jgi:hypothetical protein